MDQKREIVFSCSRCGSLNVGKPYYCAEIELKCFECGHARNYSHKRWMEIGIAGSVDGMKDKRKF